MSDVAANIAESVARLQAARDVLAHSGEVWAAGVIDRFLAGERFEIAAGLYGQPWRRRAAECRRNEKLTAVARDYFRWTGEPDDAARASRELAAELREFGARITPDSRASALATAGTGTKRRALLEILMSSPKSIGARQIGNVLRDWEMRRPSNFPIGGASCLPPTGE